MNSFSNSAQHFLFQKVEKLRRHRSKMRDTHITLAHGSGGKAMRDLIDDIFVKNFDNPTLSQLEDQASFDLASLMKQGDRLAFTTDSYVVDPLFFPGGDIGAVSYTHLDHEGQNAKGNPGRATLSVPTGICACGQGLAVADAWNHRVLIWKKLPEDNNVPADLVLGQTHFTENEPNRGTQKAAANTLNWCYGVFYHQGKLFVADTGNRRVLIWHQLPEENGQPADLVLGQPDMISRDENGGGTPSASSMRWCHDITVWGENLVVTDAGNNRVMIWQGIPTENNTPCAVVLGQKTFDSVEINQGVYFPSANSLSMPYGVAAAGEWLFVTDTANSRVLGWKKPQSILSLQNAESHALVGQINFQSKSENRDFGLPKRDSLNWSYGIKVCGNTAVIADSGNNRILLWKITNNSESHSRNT